MAITKIAFKNLSRQKRRTALLAGAIAFGIMVITIVNGLVGGLLRSAEDNVSQMVSGHIYNINYEFTDKNRLIFQIRDSKPYEKAAEELNKTYKVKYAQKRTSVFNNATLIFQNNSAWRQIDGVDWGNDKFLTEQLTILKGTLNNIKGSDGIAIGEKTAKKLSVEIGEKILIQAETIYGQQNVIEAPILAIFQENNLSGGTCYMDQEAVNGLLNMDHGTFNWYILMMENFSQIDAATNAYAKLLEKQKMAVMDRTKVAGKGFQSLFSDLRKSKDKTGGVIVANINDSLAAMKGVFDTINVVAVLVLTLLLAVIMVGLNNTYKIIVWERTREIGTMRALGMQRPQVSLLFLFEALFLAVIGTLAGIVLATFGLMIINLIDFIPKNSSSDFAIFMNKGHLDWQYNYGTMIFTVILVTLLTLFAARSPAKKASKVDPAVALRTTA